MSEPSEGLSRGSSLSLFSGLGTSSLSVSGASESGLQQNVEELSIGQLEHIVEDAKSSLKLFMLETLMFESYYERLVSGQVSLTPTNSTTAGQGSWSRKGSGTMASDSTSETDSQPPTAGTSLLDVSHKSISHRRRSGSKTSLGSRGKLLRLSNEQKCGIASREMERIEQELSEFQIQSQREGREGVAEISERVLRLEEVEKQRMQLELALDKAEITQVEKPNKSEKSSNGDQKQKEKENICYDFGKLEALLKHEVASQTRHVERLRTRNGVIKSQIAGMLANVKLMTVASEESGPVDLQQLQLERENHCVVLQNQKQEVARLRKVLALGRRRKSNFQARLSLENSRSAELSRSSSSLDESLRIVNRSLEQLHSKIRQKEKAVARMTYLKEHYHVPTIDDYLNSKWEQIQQAKQEKKEERQRRLETLKQVKRQRTKSAESCLRNPLRNALIGNAQGRIVLGTAFNLEFRIPSEA